MSDLFSPYEDRSIKDKKLNTKYQKKVVGIFVDQKDDNKPTLNRSVSDKKILALPIVLGLIFTILIGRLLFLQVVHGEEYREMSEGNRIRIQTVKAPRGIVYDRNNKSLVKNIPNFQIKITPMDLPPERADREKIYHRLAIITGISLDEIESKFEELDKKPLDAQTLFEDLPLEQAMLLQIESSELPGVSLQINARREYLTDPSFSHILGYIGKINEEEYANNRGGDYLLDDNMGKSGIELSYEDLLRGRNGKKRIEVDSRGKEKEIIASMDPIPGDDLIISIDKDMQDKTTEILKNIVDERNAPSATAIAIDPDTGEILTLANWPTYNNNSFAQGIAQDEYQALLDDEGKPLFNHAVSGEYPPGSTFKPVVAAAALEEGVVDEHTTVNSTGGIEINQWWFPDWKEGGHGQTDIRKALAQSVNTYFYLAGGGEFNAETNQINGGLGVDRIKTYAKQFGLAQKTGIDLPGEATGFMPTRDWKEKIKGEMWYIGDTYHLSIGQGDLLVTPLQVAAYTAAIANGGTYYQPHLVKEIHDMETGEIIKIHAEIMYEGAVSRQNIDIVRQGMRDAVSYGSAKGLQSLPVSSGAKTGTAQIGGTDETHSWFIVFAPYDDPEIALAVLVEKGGEGTEAALPAARDILNYYFANN
ncbi:penicillin-binding protein 2 [Patescibacteria group bacterium]|nr:penicillin-binding protein 2 [Patescibacteria group bacterium]MBU1673603.1 penicillin-binding protein 2 [Patescibacteria group bacterium]MBU1964035.1 penicillin-binding protein 2 [Patescibacteria group bacterium]